MITDVHFQIGKQHSVCQDYVVANEKVMALCDGCSASPHVDIGARLLAHLAIHLPENIMGIAMKNQVGMLNYLKLPRESEDCTLILAEDKDDKINVRIWGDGNIIAVEKDNSFEWYNIHYESGAPYYLSYLWNKERQEIYQDAVGHLSKIENYFNSIRPETNQSNKLPYSHITDVNFPKGYLKYLIISSDGIESFVDVKTGTAIQTLDIVKQIINFKNDNGEFVKRRVKRLIEDLAKDRIFNMDDVSIGCFKI